MKLNGISPYLILALFLFPPLAIGCTTDLAIGVYLGLTLITFGHLFFFSPYYSLKYNRWLGYFFWGLVGLTLFQIIPLPKGILELLSPKTLEFRGVLNELLSTRPNFLPISFQPLSTLHQIFQWIGLFLLQLIFITFFWHRDQILKGFAYLSFIAFFLIIIGFVHVGLGLNRIFGVIPMPPQTDFFVTPFINPNHFATFIGAIAPFALVFILIRNQREQRMVYLIIFLFICFGIIFSLSRGTIVLFFGLILFNLILILIMKRKLAIEPKRIYLVIGALLLTAGIGFFLTKNRLIYEFTIQKDSPPIQQRLGNWEIFPRILKDFPLTGIGKGAYPILNPIYKKNRDQIAYPYLENLYFQTLTDFGLIGGPLLLFGFLALILVALFKAGLNIYTIPALTSLLFLLLQNSLDFNLEFRPTQSLLLFNIAVLIVLSEKQKRGDPSPYEALISNQGKSKIRPLMLFCLGVLSLAGFIFTAQYQLNQDTRRLRSYLQQIARQKTPVDLKTIQPIFERHPTDYFLPLLVGHHYLAQKGKTAEAIFWLKKALFLNPTHGQTYYLLGRAYYQLGRPILSKTAYRRAYDLLKTARIQLEMKALFGAKLGDF